MEGKHAAEWRAGLIAFAVVVLLVAFFFFWPVKPPPQRPKQAPPPPVPEVVYPPGLQDFPSTDGSEVTEPLGRLVGYKLLDVPYEWSQQPDRGRWLGVKDYNALAKLFARQIYLRHNGTDEAFEKLLNGQVRLIYVTRTPTAEEQKRAAAKNVGLDARLVAYAPREAQKRMSVYAVIRTDEPENSPARRLRQWLLTEEGEAAVREAGFRPSRESATVDEPEQKK